VARKHFPVSHKLQITQNCGHLSVHLLNTGLHCGRSTRQSADVVISVHLCDNQSISQCRPYCRVLMSRCFVFQCCYVAVLVPRNRRKTKTKRRRRRRQKTRRRRKRKKKRLLQPLKKKQQRRLLLRTKTSPRKRNEMNRRKKLETSSLSSISRKSQNSKRCVCAYAYAVFSV